MGTDFGTYHVASSGRFAGDDAATPVRRPDSSMDEDGTKSTRDVDIKQERMETSSSHEEEEESQLGSGKSKKLRIEVADAESNTHNSGKCTFIFFFCGIHFLGEFVHFD